MINFNILIFTLIFFINISIIFADAVSNKTCQNLIKALDLNTGAYNKCLFAKAGEKYTAEDLKACQVHYLTEIERLSYVYKNICK